MENNVRRPTYLREQAQTALKPSTFEIGKACFEIIESAIRDEGIQMEQLPDVLGIDRKQYLDLVFRYT